MTSERELAEVRGQEFAKRALEIAAAGGHPLLLVGPAAVGKSLIARCASGILPSPIKERVLKPCDATPRELKSALTCRDAVVILEELSRFAPASLAALHETAGGRHPSLLLLATMRSCPCGRHEWQPEGCLCTNRELLRHAKRLSEVVYHFQLRADLIPTALVDLRRGPGEPTAHVARRVAAARRRQEERGALNASAEPPNFKRHFADPEQSSRLLARAREVLPALPAGNTLRVTRTIADLRGKEKIDVGHLAEAIAYRPLGAPNT